MGSPNIRLMPFEVTKISFEARPGFFEDTIAFSVGWTNLSVFAVAIWNLTCVDFYCAFRSISTGPFYPLDPRLLSHGRVGVCLFHPCSVLPVDHETILFSRLGHLPLGHCFDDARVAIGYVFAAVHLDMWKIRLVEIYDVR